MKAANISNAERPRLFSNRFLSYITHFNPFRGELVEVEMKVVGNQIRYSYTKVKKGH